MISATHLFTLKLIFICFAQARRCTLPSQPLSICNTDNDLASDMSSLLQLECLHNASRRKWEGTSRIDARHYLATGNELKDSIQVRSF